jgi:hypothetical protein
VADAEAPARRVGGDPALQIADFAGALGHMERSIDDRHPGRVIPAILQAAETFEQNLLTVSKPDIANDAAHAVFPRLDGTGRPFFRVFYL